ncbi:MAG: hypothetical protein ACLUQ6_05105 [Alistipes onderdonkii]
MLCAITIAKIPSAIFLRKFMIAAACCEVLCFVVSFYWKISLHLTAMGAARGAAGGDERCGRRQHDGAADGRHSLCGCTGLRTPLPGAAITDSRCLRVSAAALPSRRWLCCSCNPFSGRICFRCGSPHEFLLGTIPFAHGQ